MLELSTTPRTAEQTAEERTPLFKVDGVEYFMPAEIGMAVGLKYLKTIRTHGEDVALGQMFEEVIGTDAYDALCRVPNLKGSDLKQLMAGVQQIVIGQLEEATGN